MIDYLTYILSSLIQNLPFSHERSNNAIINLYSDLDILQAMSGVGGEVAIQRVPCEMWSTERISPVLNSQ